MEDFYNLLKLTLTNGKILQKKRKLLLKKANQLGLD